MLQSPQKRVKWGNSNEQTAIEKHLEQVWVFVNTEAPWLGAIQTACYIKFYAESTSFGIGEVPIFKNAD